MRRICVINYKGGTGKTSTVVNLAHGLAVKGKRVLIIDTDPQGSVGHHFGLNPEKNLYDVLVGSSHYSECIVKVRKNLDIICSNERLYPAELAMASMPKREHVLKRRLKGLSGYDFVILDCAPSINLLNQNVLLYSTEVLLPVSMEYLALVGVKQLLKNIQIINRILSERIVINYVIPTFYKRNRRKSQEVLDSLERVFPGAVTTPIRSSEALSQAPGFRKTVFEHAPKSAGALDYGQLVMEVLNGRTK